MSIGLLSTLDKGDFDAALVLTYTLNLRFFEELVLPRLRRMGIGRIGILVDEKGYQDSLDDPLRQDECGRSYLVAPARLPRHALQHAKLLFLWSPDRQVAYIGSHNLTMAGFNDQLEVTAVLDSSDPTHVAALRDLHTVVSQVMSPVLDTVWKHFREPAANDTKPSVRFLSSFERALRVQMVEVARPSDSLRVVTPFLDAVALQRLALGVRAEDATLDVPHGGADTPVIDAIAAIPGLSVRNAPDDRRLHAKAYEFRSARTSWLALGSANCTQAALERSVHEGGNLEFLVMAEGARLSDEVVFAPVSDPEQFPSTGRRWDEERPPACPIVIHGAEFRDGRLRVDWGLQGSGELASLRLEVEPGDESTDVNVSGTRAMIDVQGVPTVVSLRGTVSGAPCLARAWVTVPAMLDDHAKRRRNLRWLEPIMSTDPIQQADHISAFFDQILRDYFRAARGDSPARDAASGGSTRDRQTGRRMREFVEVFRFSPDRDHIRRAAEELLGGQGAVDPLAILRSLISRHEADPLPEIEQEPDAAARYQRRQERGRRVVGESLARHLDQLSRAEYDWSASSPRDLTYCLSQTLGAITLVWHEVVARHEARRKIGSRLAESFTALMNRLSNCPATMAVLRGSEAAGPAVLALGAVADAAEEDSFITDRLRRIGRNLLGDDPRPVLRKWKEDCAQRAEVLLSYARGSDPFFRWERSATRLWGAGQPSSKWTLLLELQKADLGDSSRRDELHAEATRRYAGPSADESTRQAWQRYETARGDGRLPVVQAVSKPTCWGCNTNLPSAKAGHLRHDAVVCDCGRILVPILP